MDVSFSSEVKEELSKLNNLANKDEVEFEFLGYLESDNTIQDKEYIRYSTESDYNIDRFAKIARNMGFEEFNINVNGKVFYLEIDKYSISDIWNNKDNQIIELLNSENKKLQRAFIRGLFMGAGSINNPEKKYHLEFSLRNQKYFEIIINMMKENDINLKQRENILYIKEGEEISKFLAFIGAAKAVLKFEEIRVQRYMNNKVNRLVNCETANLNKVLNASVEQTNAIRKLKQRGEFKKLDDNLKEIAELRLQNPDMPLQELGKLLSTPIGKSGVNYRLKKIIDIANEL